MVGCLKHTGAYTIKGGKCLKEKNNYLKKWEVLVYKYTIYIIEETNRQKRQNKKRKPKEELKQSANTYKIYCGVEHSSARCLKR